MKITVVTPNFNGEAFLEACIQSILAQRAEGIDLQYIVMDAGSTDGSLAILERYRDQIDLIHSGPDDGPADAINKGFKHASGELLAWLNADDLYHPRALARAIEAFETNPKAAICFGHCPIIDPMGNEIRKPITRFKECFYPLSSRFTFQCINYISQPAMVFRRTAWEQAGPLRTDLHAAWDYDLVLRLLHHGRATRLHRPPLASFRWTPHSISGSSFRTQFREEYEAAIQDAGGASIQGLLHLMVWGGIIGAYSLMEKQRNNNTTPPHTP